MTNNFLEMNNVDLIKLEALATSFANKLLKGDIILLEGPLGAGKTQFVKFVANKLSETNEQVTSPTFSIIKEYDKFIHIDAYRVFDEDLGLEDYSDKIIFIEWSENIIKYLPKWDYKVKINYNGQNRNITIEKKAK